MSLCACGCGQETNIAKKTGNGYTKGEPYRFANGHHVGAGGWPRGCLPFAPADVGPNTKALARRLGVHRRQIYFWRERGVNVDRAEWLADKLGRHPSELWNNYYEVACS